MNARVLVNLAKLHRISFEISRSNKGNDKKQNNGKSNDENHFVYSSIFISDSSIEFFSFEYKKVFVRFDYSTFERDRSSCDYIITSDHSNNDTSALTFCYGARNLEENHFLSKQNSSIGESSFDVSQFV